MDLSLSSILNIGKMCNLCEKCAILLISRNAKCSDFTGNPISNGKILVSTNEKQTDKVKSISTNLGLCKSCIRVFVCLKGDISYGYYLKIGVGSRVKWLHFSDFDSMVGSLEDYRLCFQ